MKNILLIKNLHAKVEEKEVLKGIDLAINAGEVHAVMGPNGSGKTSLVMTMMGHPGYKITFHISRLAAKRAHFTFQIGGKDMRELLPEERAKEGLFVSFQNPIEIQGVSFLAFLRTAAKSLRPAEKKPLSQFKEEVRAALKAVGLQEEFMHRSVNEGFSGGEKKRAEVAQVLVLQPRLVVLDEIDSGLDVDSLKVIARVISEAAIKYSMSILLITHYQRLLHFVKPQKIHVLVDGKIKRSGGMELVEFIEKEGYAAI